MVLANVQKWDTDAKKMAHMPLMLDKAAYLVFDELSDNDKKDADKVKKALEIAFAPSAGESYRRFVACKMRVEESVDGYVADLKRLLTMSGHNVAADDKDPMLMKQFVSGLPANFAREVRIQCASGAKTMTEVTDRVRAMAVAVETQGQGVSAGKSSVDAAGPRSVMCFKCGQGGHMRRDCPRRDAAGGRSRDSSRMRCFRCKQIGHMKKVCPQPKPDVGAAANL